VTKMRTCHLILWSCDGGVPVAISRITHVSVEVSHSSQGVGWQRTVLVAAKHALGEGLASVVCDAAHIKLAGIREVWQVALAGQLVCGEGVRVCPCACRALGVDKLW
jgi:hypothetical protein